MTELIRFSLSLSASRALASATPSNGGWFGSPTGHAPPPLASGSEEAICTVRPWSGIPSGASWMIDDAVAVPSVRVTRPTEKPRPVRRL